MQNMTIQTARLICILCMFRLKIVLAAQLCWWSSKKF